MRPSIEPDADVTTSDIAWRRFATGGGKGRAYSSIKRDARGYPIFVRATALSDTSAEQGDEEADDSLLPLGTLDDQHLVAEDARKGGAEEQGGRSLAESESMASLYARLTRELPARAATMHSQGPPEVSNPTYPPSSSISSSKRTTQSAPSGRQWFIQRAIAQQAQGRWISSEAVELDAVGSGPGSHEGSLQTFSRCSTCNALLPCRPSTAVLASHQASIAHQLAMDVSNFRPAKLNETQSSSRFSNGISGTSKEAARLVLNSSNVGYLALERMGWRRGMGLGREEWEFAQCAGTSASESDSKKGGQAKEIIVLSEEEEEGADGDDDGLRADVSKVSTFFDEEEEDVGTMEWLLRLGNRATSAVKTFSPSPSPPPAQKVQSEAQQQTSRQDEETSKDLNRAPTVESHARSRPMLEPIPVHVRPDRRGIGVALPRSARVRDRPGLVGGMPKATVPNEKRRLSKRERLAKEERERAERKALRASLND